MARIEVRVPPLGESAPEGLLHRWLKQAGDPVERDELILEIETDKVAVEVVAAASGRLAEVCVPAGATVRVNDLLGIIDTDRARPFSAPVAPAPPVPAVDCLRCGARLEPASSAARMQFAGEPVHLLVCRRCGHVEMIAEDPARF